MRGFTSALRLLLPALALAFAASPALAGVNWWTPIGPEGGTASSLVFDPATRTLYAAANGSVFASNDGGTTWERRSRGLQMDVKWLAAASTPTPALYAAGSYGLSRSADGGASWTVIDFDSDLDVSIGSLAVDPADSAAVLVGTLSRGEILRSTDGGATWSRVSQSFACGGIHSLQKRPGAATWYAGCSSGRPAPFFRSTDAGATWMPGGSPLPSPGENYIQVVPDPDLDGVLYASAIRRWITTPEWAVYKTTKDGAAWTFLTESSGPLVAGSAGQLLAGSLRSTDGGASWKPLGLPGTPGALAFDPAEPSTLFAGLPAGIYRSTDDATTWSLQSQGLFATEVASLEIAPDSTLYAWVPGLGLRKRPAGASRWRRADQGLPLDEIFDSRFTPALAIDPATPSNLYVGWASGFARSADGGASWTTTGSADGPCVRIHQLALDPRDLGRIYAAGYLSAGCSVPGSGSCRVFFSEDGGTSWTCGGDDRLGYVTALVVDSSSQPSRLYATSLGEGLWTSADRGRTWRQLKGLRRFGDTFLTVAVDPRNPLQLYAGDLYGGLYKSTDRGATWATFSRGLPKNSVRELLVDPQRPQTVYANSSGEGVYVTGNGGRTWYPLNGGLASAPGEIRLDPRNPRKLYAATYRNGIYAHERR